MHLTKELKPKKSLGQNFLADQRVVRDLVAASEIKSTDIILEPGAGTGTVTKELAKRAGKVFAVEIDAELIPILKENLQGITNIEIINDDVLCLLAPPALLDGSAFGGRGDCSQLKATKIVGSIPYQITSPLIHKLLFLKNPPELICLIIQKEVAQKITARPPRATYLSNFIQAFAEVKIVRWIKPGAFRPQPKVNSAIIKIAARPRTDDLVPRKFSKFLHRGFAHPRKMLNKVFPEKVLKETGINPQARAQELELQQWLHLLQKLGISVE